MKLNSLCSLFVFMVLLGNSCLGAMMDTLVKNDSIVQYYHIDDVGIQHSNSKALDLDLDGFQIYKPCNSYVGSGFNDWNSSNYRNGVLRLLHLQGLGVTGSASQSLFFSAPSKLGFELERSSFRLNNQLMDQLKYYQLYSPFTELYYVTGSKKEQILKVIHAQQVAKKFNIGVELQKINAEGFYLRQKTDHTSFSANLDYTTPNDNYTILVAGTWNTNYAQENGGIQDDLLFEDSLSITKNTIEVHLDSAENSWSRNDLVLKQIFRIGKSRGIGVDSGATVSNHSVHRIYHMVEYMNMDNRYTDHLPNPDFYPAFFKDSSYTSDHLGFLKVANTMGWSSYNGSSEMDSLEGTKEFNFELEHQYAEYHQENLDSFMNNAMARVRFIKRESLGLSYSILGEGIWFGPNQGDYKIQASGFYKKDPSAILTLSATMSSQTPPLFATVYSSNHYQWNHKFLKRDVISSVLDYSNEAIHFNMGLGIQLLKNHIYYDSLALPTQHEASFPMVSLYVGKDFNMGNFKLNSRVVAQYVEDNLPIRIPSIVTYNSLYYSNWIFKKALFIQVGLDIWYNTSYFADSYMPVTSVFYNQNAKEIGNYPYLDAFINFKIKNARLFMKLAHVNSGLMGNRYYMVPHYPMYDRSFQFGVSWVFND